VTITRIEIANNSLAGSLVAWPVGTCYEGCELGGAALLINLKSEGYSLAWPSELGPKPYENGHGDCVIRVDWLPGSVFSAPANFFQRHFNTGQEAAVHLALGCGSEKFPLGMAPFAAPKSISGEPADEDRVIRHLYETELRRKGLLLDANYLVAANGD
jgi:hypothetical protein